MVCRFHVCRDTGREAAKLEQTSVPGIECRLATCRVDVLHVSDLDAEEFAIQFPALVGERFPEIRYHTERHADGQVSVVMFLRTDEG